MSLKIVHFNNLSRSSLGITQGLNQVANVKNNNFKETEFADFIFVSDIVSEKCFSFFEKNKLWNKIIHYDYRDTNLLELNVIEKCHKSFKRSILIRESGSFIKDIDKIEHIAHCALDEYYLFSEEKDFDIGCFFDINNKDLGVRRSNLINTLSKLNIKNSLIGKSTGCKQEARMAIHKDKKNNIFYRFLELQSRCKIIFTAQPSHCEGDNRTWEAMSSGSLVFLDLMHSYYKFPLIDNKHCIFYNALDTSSILEAYDKAKYYLKNEKERRKIATQGFNFVKKYHRPINRVAQMIKVFKIF